MKIGIDFGTAYTKIAYPGNDAKPRLFRFPGETGHDYIPTAIAYETAKKKIWLGENANLKAVHDDIDFYNNLKMRIPMQSVQEWEKDGWVAERSPMEVVSDYFKTLLFDDNVSFQKYVGRIEQVVVSVPELWYQDIKAPGPSNLLRVLKDIGLNVDHLQSEPVCAAAYYAYQLSHKNKGFENPFTLLVCDVGGGTFDAALCLVNLAEIRVLDHAGNGQKGLAAAGVAFDRNCMISAYKVLKKVSPVLSSKGFTHLLNIFESEKIHDSGEVSELMQATEFADSLTDTVIYKIIDGNDKYQITLGQALTAFLPIQNGIESVLKNIQKNCIKKGENIDRVLVVGGFGQYPMVQHVIRKTLGLTKNDPRWVILDQPSRFYAIAYGTYLLAQGNIQATMPYPHTLGIRARELVNGKMVDSLIPVIRAGESRIGMLQPEFARQADGQPLVVQVDSYKTGELPVYIQAEGSGEKFTTTNIASFEYPPEGHYHVGFQVDQSNLVSLIFRNISRLDEQCYELGKIDLIPIKEPGNG